MTMPRRPHLLAALLLTLVVAACYANSLDNGFVVDDHTNIVENARIKDLRNLPFLATKAYFGLAGPLTFYYRPLATFSFFADYALWRANPAGFHLTNLFLHIGTSLLVYALLVRLVNRWGPALLGSALFAAHPALTETVNYISGGRNASLSAGLLLMALWCFLGHDARPREGRTQRWLVAAGLGAYGLALLAKESAAVLVLLLPLTDWARTPGRPAWWRRRLRLYVGLVLFTAGYLVLRLGVMASPLPLPSAPLTERLLVWPYATWLHLRLLVLPWNLSAHYFFQSPQRVTDPMVVFPLAMAAVLLLGLVWLWVRDQRLACLGLAWIFVTLGPVSNVIAFVSAGVQPVAERYLYLPAVGFVLLLTLALMRVRARALALSLAGLLLLTYGALTLARTPVWRDNLTLWRDTVEKMPESPWAHSNLGIVYEARGDFVRAAPQHAWAADVFDRLNLPMYAVVAYHRAGWAYLKQGRLEPAIRVYQEALRLNPTLTGTHENLAVLYTRLGRHAEARAEHEAAQRPQAR